MMNWWRRRNWKYDALALDRFAGLNPATVITGATRGIGYELARQMVQTRQTVVLIARSQEDLQNAQQRLTTDLAKPTAHPIPSIVTIPIDITSTAAETVIRETLLEHDLYVDELINNAGIGLSGRFADEVTSNIDNLLSLNIEALTRLTRAFLPDMLIRGRGGIINFASLGGLTAGPYQAAYYASKSYVISLTQAIKYENRGQGVRFTVIAPGPVETRFHANMDAERAFYRRFLPAMSVQAIARSTLFWYKLNRTIVVPGVLNSILALCLWILPGFLTTPVVAFLLNPRDTERDTGSQSN